jgi:uncharacterized protein (TIGR02145 family)
MRIRIRFILIIISGVLWMLTNRCKKDEATTVTDIDGNIYNTVTIGTQVWMAENLKTTKYCNGDLIGTTAPATLNIGLEPNPKYQWAYDGNEINAATYGRLYTWHTVTDSRNICPVGWHVPTDAEWHTLILYLDNSASLTLYESTTAGSTLKEAGTAHWPSPNTGATNESGFTALPGGYRYNNGAFYGFGSCCIWWGSTEVPTNDGNAWIRVLQDIVSSSSVGRDNGCKVGGYSVRCLKNN